MGFHPEKLIENWDLIRKKCKHINIQDVGGVLGQSRNRPYWSIARWVSIGCILIDLDDTITFAYNFVD